MSVEQDNYPDNYYSDISSSSQYYYEIMLATEFGLVDVEAGDALRPDDPATREFAAHTLNLCLGYTLEEKIYTYQESSTVAWPEDIQISINKGWFQLNGNTFMPEKPVTITEKEVLLADAAVVLESVVINPNHNNQYEFEDNVIVLPEGTAAVLSGENQITIYNCPITLRTGDVFAIIENDFPVVNKAISITISGEKTIINVENVSMEDAFKSIDIQGSMASNLTQAQAYGSDIQISYIVGGTQENEWEDGQKYDDPAQVNEQNVNAIEVVKSYDIPENVKAEFNLGDGLKATITCKITDVQLKYSSNATGCYMDFNTIATFNCNVSLDVLKAIGVAPSIELVYVSVGVVGYAKVSLDLTVKGNVTLSIVERISAGVHFSVTKGFRLVTDFQKISFTIQARAEISVGITVAVGINAGFIKGSIYGKVGAKATIEAETFTDGYNPLQCVHVQAWLYVTTGCKVSINILIFKKDWSKEITIYNFNNSPVRVSYHFEDGSPVDRCTRDAASAGEEKRWKYYTPANSSYGYNGASSGTDSTGESYTIFNYSLDSDNRATITGYNGNVTALSIPDSLDGYTVAGIGASAFKNNKVLRIVVITDSITTIANNAFEGCSNLQTLDMADSVITIGNYAFNNCTALANVSLSKKIETIGYSAFANCISLTEIEIPKSLDNVANYGGGYNYNGAFRNCSNLKKVSFESGTTKVVRNLFYNCTGLEEIALPDTITIIGDSAFKNCTELFKITMSTALISIGDSAFDNCSNLLELKLPDSVTLIGDHSFEDCISIHTVILSKNIEEIGYSAFANCISLTEIEIPKSLNNVAGYGGGYNYNGAFRNCSNLKKVSFESGTTKVARNLFYNCTGLEEIVLPDTITIIGDSAFKNCTELSKITMSTALISIGDSAFDNCNNLLELKLPDSVTLIGDHSFEDCISIHTVILSKNIKEIGYSAFANCISLTEIEIPKSLNNVAGYGGGYNYNGAFRNCSNLKKVSFESGTTKVARNLFYNCTGLEEIEIPGSVTYIGDNAFTACSSLLEVNIPNSVNEVGTYAFQNCTSLSKVSLPDSMVDLVTGLFDGCQSLKEINIPETLQSIKKYSFRNCTSLEEIALPQSLVNLETYAFYNCKSLKKIIMHEGVKTIDSYAFAGCSALEKVYLPDSLLTLGTNAFLGNQALTDIRIGINIETIPANCFKDCGALQTITLPYGITSIGDSAFANNTSLTEVIMNRKVSSIVTNAFSYPDILTIYGVPGSYPEEYAASRNITFIEREVAATRVIFKDTEISVNKGKSFIPAITIEPEGFTDEIIWRSTDTDIITVSDKGVITAKKTGTAVIRVNVGEISAEISVVVRQPVTSISLNKTALIMEAREAFTLTANISPSDAYDKTVKWTTSDSSVATVGSTGLVTAIAKGTAVITATAKDGSEVYKSCNITVTNDAYICENYTELESAHNYPNNFSDSWIYSQSGASSLTLVFDERTSLESGFDYLYLYDGSGQEVGKYTGTELAGKTVLINGDTVRIKLVSDTAGNAWGFKVTSVAADIKPVEFSDVKEGSWQSAPAQYVYQRGIMTGKGTDASGNVIFAPNDNLTRAEFAQILYSAEGKPKLSYRERFSDVADSMWYTSAILWAADQGIVSGYGDGRYGTHDNITREQLAAMLYKYAEYKGYDTSARADLGSFTDSGKVSSWAKSQLQWAVSNGVMSGKGAVLDPLGNATRAECAAMLRTFMNRFE